MTLIVIWSFVLVFNLVWIVRKKPYHRFKVVKLNKLKLQINKKQY